MENLRRQYNDNVQKFKADFADCSDFLLKEAETGGRKCFFAVMDGLVDSLQLGQMIMGPVLGAQVKPDGTLSLQLQYRMELALEQYHAHPQVIVVCGAQGGNEPMTEAQAMHDYLVSNGVPEGDILMDDTSFNTRQNLTNAQKLLGDDVKKVLIVTSNYHLPRAMALARDTGFEPQGVGAPIKLIYWPKNHYREALAWVKYLLQKWSILPY